MINQPNINHQLTAFKQGLMDELSRILAYWAAITPDTANGGFYGKIDNNNKITAEAPKGSVLNARILWTFSAAYNRKADPLFMVMAKRAYQYICDKFIDGELGGVYWSVDYKGKPLDTKKQVYAISFTIYALSEFYRASAIEAAKQKAIDLFHLLVEKAYDPIKTGYFEAFTKDWQSIADLRLSDKDANEKKTMNTHLHVLEGFTNLYRIWPDITLRDHISGLLNNFFSHFIDHKTWHLALFFDENWNRKGDLISYGHDIEATWLLLEAAEVIGEEASIQRIKEIAIKITDATIAGLDTDGGLWYEYDPSANHLIKEKHWWVQAEALVGFFNAWQISGDEKYLNIAINNWQFINNKILDKQNGEWFWGINENGQVMPGEDKAGLWKCPYHNSRACMEIIRRIS
ncbi:AGE family epimerase/isomerase [Mucilaginibacter sp. BJC16-A38]|uniref:AGE family epimerase/isomerase n=1 Tax=Mucilaginibacter phenanthrenivorans TaxID=1234842 RepID=UPI00215884DC|nr:AGE family epimerase/isomerase [Mucilaginibacter phenanthrenivorans]MCR8558060.1 AGE family epimerase/isomerase [Mucilaginibacter phenanthrenivorans]